MTKQKIKQNIKNLMKAGKPSLIKMVFYLQNEYTALTHGNNLQQLTPDELSEILRQYPEINIKAFDLSPVWDEVEREFNTTSFRASLPELIRQAKGMEVILCDSIDKANRYIELKQQNEFTGYFETVEGKEAILGTPSKPGVYYVDLPHDF